MSAQPVRLQRSRKKGSRLVSPNGLPNFCVTRPGRWGNLFDVRIFGLETSLELYRETVLGGWNPNHVRHLDDDLCHLAYQLKCKFQKRFGGMSQVAIRTELRGHNLACFCRLDQNCHADILLELANGDA